MPQSFVDTQDGEGSVSSQGGQRRQKIMRESRKAPLISQMALEVWQILISIVEDVVSGNGINGRSDGIVQV